MYNIALRMTVFFTMAAISRVINTHVSINIAKKVRKKKRRKWLDHCKENNYEKEKIMEGIDILKSVGPMNPIEVEEYMI
jgi:hypothetical protein